ncbi:hypothetical protein [Dapis sp. BLCC M229]|uniref:hypothetical protein n=1 Tax=Dapis sp. BLCC M229 TaxID=3400188 RepID=UPI003CE80E3B
MNTYSVIMLGPSGSGKTVFLASMYKKLSTHGKLGFFLKVEGAEKRKRLNNIYTQIAFEEEWPTGNKLSEVSEWKFTCCVQTKDLSIYDACKFIYIDYAGGRLTDEMEEEDEEFNNKIQAADIMLVLLDGQRLCNLMRREKPGMVFVSRELPNMLQEVQKIQNKPVHFVISKWDIVEPHYSLQQIRDRLLEIEEFTNLVRARNEAGTPVRLIPVSSVGKGFATLLQDGSMAKNVGVLPKPFQLEVPLACILPDIIQNQVEELIKKITAEQGKKIEVKAELSFGERLGQFLGFLGGGVKKLQQSLPEEYQFGEDIIENLIETAERPAREKVAEAQRRTEELRAKQAESLNKVVDEKTALDSAVNSFSLIKNQLDIDFPESDLRNVL